ncbi:hypothetical protein I350_04487 [Cryptococcus amylolentus CBS 6273]|uniref:Myb/SANT-like domain-containing protein n=1 Tax=Cryptococcus amylolentus CBS 6273 TaxID=1296118 RepID=A0A1E3K1S7_9TREE|nr:hypothetical protein I350_04487 [Cryptococcus amylolentus CBS 6273]
MYSTTPPLSRAASYSIPATPTGASQTPSTGTTVDLTQRQSQCDASHVSRQADAPKVAKYCVWSDADDSTMVGVLTDAKIDGRTSDNGFKAGVWTKVIDAVNPPTSGKPKNLRSAKDRHGHLSRDWAVMRDLRFKNTSGWEWDDANCMVTAPDEVWDRYLEAHPGHKKYRDKPFPLYDQYEFLLSDVMATGANVVTAGDPSSPVESTSTVPSVPEVMGARQATEGTAGESLEGAPSSSGSGDAPPTAHHTTPVLRAPPNLPPPRTSRSRHSHFSGQQSMDRMASAMEQFVHVGKALVDADQQGRGGSLPDTPRTKRLREAIDYTADCDDLDRHQRKALIRRLITSDDRNPLAVAIQSMEEGGLKADVLRTLADEAK